MDFIYKVRVSLIEKEVWQNTDFFFQLIKKSKEKVMGEYGMKKQVPIFRKLFVTFSTFALIPVILTGAFGIYILTQTMLRNLQNNMSDSVNQTVMMVDSKLEEMKFSSDNLIYNTELKNLLHLPMTEENALLLNQEMEKINGMNLRQGYQVTLGGNNGQIFINWQSDGMIYRNSLVDQIKQNEWYRELENSRSIPVWIPYMDNIDRYSTSKKVLTVARNIMNDRLGEEDILGFVIISVPLDKISGVLEGIMEQTYIVDEHCQVVMSQNRKEIGNTLVGIQLSGMGTQKITMNETVYLGSVKENEIGGLYTVVLIPTEEFYRQVVLALVIVAFLIMLSVGIIFFVAYIMSKSLSNPITELETSMKKVQKGQLEETEIKSDITEMTVLGENFNIMVKRIQDLITEKVEEEQKRKEIEIEKTHAELKFLRAQIMPHFLFNTLNSIKWLAVIHGAVPVEEMITALGRLLECSMQKGNDFIPLVEELENVKAYLKIQEMRYGSRLKVTYEIEDGMQTLMIPKLILQPLVENALIHGIDKNPDGGLISVRIVSEEDMIRVEVEDDGPGIPEDMAGFIEEKPEERKRRLSGIGVSNVNKRIQLIYGKKFGLTYRRGEENKGTVAILILKKEEQHAEGIISRR